MCGLHAHIARERGPAPPWAAPGWEHGGNGGAAGGGSSTVDGRVLYVDDDPALGEVVQRGLGRGGLTVTVATSGEAAYALVREADFDVVITDLRMPGLSGTELGARIAANQPRLPVIVVTAFGSLGAAVAALRAGAYDFVTKPFALDVLALAAERAIRHRRLQQEVVRLRARVASGRAAGLLGESEAMREVLDQLGRVAPTDATVLVTGESGTGKELVARAIHERSARREGPFVALSCAAMPAALLESELFGHVRGAFTDARADHAGLFVAASGGTLFLDELGELPLALQPKLLRALQERCVRPLGGEREVPFDVRLVTATNRDLDAAVEAGTFRADLYYRVQVVHLALPPLRARGGDVLLLAQHALASAAARFGKPVQRFTPAAAALLAGYPWPGNVRELGNAVESAVALARFSELGVDDLPARVRAYSPAQVVVAAPDPAALVPLATVEERYIRHALEVCGGNQSLAAQHLQIDRKTLARRLR